MTPDEFASEVTRVADSLEKMNIPHFILAAACIEAACNMAIADQKVGLLADKFREVADMLEGI